ncbi:MAG: hypothetical protein EZS28_052554, partial [Streblomastix strix]
MVLFILYQLITLLNRLQWSRLSQLGDSDIIENENRMEYEIRKEDVGKTLRLDITPVVPVVDQDGKPKELSQLELRTRSKSPLRTTIKQSANEQVSQKSDKARESQSPDKYDKGRDQTIKSRKDVESNSSQKLGNKSLKGTMKKQKTIIVEMKELRSLFAVTQNIEAAQPICRGIQFDGNFVELQKIRARPQCLGVEEEA